MIEHVNDFCNQAKRRRSRSRSRGGKDLYVKKGDRHGGDQYLDMLARNQVS
jgi:hypothetical protein